MSNLRSRSLFVSGLAWTLFASGAAAQQFNYQSGLIPGTARWTEGVEAADVDNDGDIDIFFAEGEGFSGPGAQRQNTLVINQFVGTGSLAFTNESVARLGVHLSNAKGVATGDIDGDGWVDAIFANAFNNHPPYLYVNQGAGNPGFFTEDAAARGLTEVMNSAAAGFGDLDDDGDLDLIICDSGANFLGGSGDRPNLYINNGTGQFTEKMGAGWNPPIKDSQMDVHFVDVDNDFDLDFVGYCRGSNSGGNHYLMINDGNANFTDSSSTLPDGSSSCYEAELGDLDGDGDADIFMVSLSGFREGAIKNNWIEGGMSNLTFTPQAPLSISQDDNEIAFCDFDDDGDLDAFVGSLGTKERLWRNDGGLVFTASFSTVQTVGDATLDCTFADLDNDGDYDFITAQGEGQSSQWVNKVYVNSGPADTRAPYVLGERIPDPIVNPMGPWVGHVKLQDALMDDGVNYVTGEVHYVVVDSPLDPVVNITGAGFSPANLNVPAGTDVRFTNNSGSNQSVTSTTAPYTYDSGVMFNGANFTHVYVRPGVYQYTSGPSGFNGTITVMGAVQTATAEYSGGGIYRGAMVGNASAPGAELYYEFEFVDYAGNRLVTEGRNIIQDEGATKYCFGDGSSAPCPCSGFGVFGEGCLNTGGTGASLDSSGVPSFSFDTFQLHVSGVPGAKPGLVIRGSSSVAVPAGDGILCTTGASQRSQVQITVAGSTTFTDFNGSPFGSVANGGGAPTYFQFWYRDPSNTCSGAGFNFTNGVKVTYAP